MDFKLWVENTDWDFSHEEGFGGKVQQKDIDGVSIVYQMQSNGNVQLSSIRVKHKDRKMGKARSAIIEFLRETDNAGKSVELLASPLDSKTNLSKLVAFYQSVGFEIVGMDGSFNSDK